MGALLLTDYTFIDRDPFADRKKSKPKKREQRPRYSSVVLPSPSKLEMKTRSIPVFLSPRRAEYPGHCRVRLFYSYKCPGEECGYWTGFYIWQHLAHLMLKHHVNKDHQ